MINPKSEHIRGLMRIYYFDDSGDRSGDPQSPFFVLGGFGIDADQLPLLKRRLLRVTAAYGFHLGHPAELKFNHVGRGSDNKPRKPHWMLRSGLTDRNQRRALVYSCLRETLSIPSVGVLAVAVDQRRAMRQKPIEAAIHPLLERVQMDAQKHGTTALVMMDEEQADDRFLRTKLREGSAFIRQFTAIQDTISFMPSEESPGIQVADLIAGSVGRFLNSSDSGYVRTFWRSVISNGGSVHGAGMKIYPRGQCDSPLHRAAPWSDTDRAIHEYEFKARGSNEVHWNPDGSPDWVWVHDTDSEPRSEK